MALDLVQFNRAKYIALTTYKRSGDPVSTPVWFAVDGETILVWTTASAGKVKRLRNNPACSVAICDARGRVKGPAYDAKATLLESTSGAEVHRLLNGKYGVTKRAFELFTGLWDKVRRKTDTAEAYIEIRLMR